MIETTFDRTDSIQSGYYRGNAARSLFGGLMSFITTSSLVFLAAFLKNQLFQLFRQFDRRLIVTTVVLSLKLSYQITGHDHINRKYHRSIYWEKLRTGIICAMYKAWGKVISDLVTLLCKILGVLVSIVYLIRSYSSALVSVSFSILFVQNNK